MVRGKFKVSKIELTTGSRKVRTADGLDYEKEEYSPGQFRDKYEFAELHTVILTPVYANNDPTHENTKFWDASPSGEIKLGTINPGAWQQFELEKEYYVDFTKVEEAQS